ncbi:MAG: hypothetical protein II187_01430 [Treponema sp.]|nr:hypothetical protein [Treponema sp.]
MERIVYPYAAVLVLALSTLFAGCSMSAASYNPSAAGSGGAPAAAAAPATETVAFTVPLAAAKTVAAPVVLRYASAPGKQSELQVNPGDMVPLCMEKNKPAAVLLSEKTAGGAEPYRNVAAFIYPYSLEPEEKNCFPALILYELYTNDADCRDSAEVLEHVHLFNWPKLVDACAGYEDAEHTLQKEPVLAAVKKGSFKKSDIKKVKKPKK